ncbi:site-specific integrase [Candidatus Micrarchaeota archaeon]|nr:site-specific integrase [Candidatus Micrarchaeota archaeon]
MPKVMGMGPRGSGVTVSSTQQPVSCREMDGQTASSTQQPECTKAQSTRTNREISKELTHNWPKIKGELEHYGRYLTKWNLVKAITILSEARKYRFLRRRTPKYGSMNKAFTDEELEHFFSVIRDPKLHLLFSYQAILGLRIGEAVRVHIKDINLKTRELRIFTEKSGKTDYLLIPEALFDRTVRYINAYDKDIAAARGFLFFSFARGRRIHMTESHYTTETARKFFRKYAQKAKLEEIYGYSAGAKPHELRRLTPHSLRHYAITNFCRKNGGNVMLAAKFARHTNLQITMTYIHAKKEELYESIERANDENLLRRVREMQDEIVV